MMNYSTLNSMVKSIFLFVVSQLMFIQIASAQCPPSIGINCTAGFLIITGEFDSPMGAGNCPASLDVTDDASTTVTVPRSGACAAGVDTYFLPGDPAPFDCATTTVTFPFAGETCEYDGSGTLLPIELGKFSAAIDNNKVTLSWITYTELNNDYFTIEKSTDGVNFEAIAEESGAGTTFEEQRYSFTDNEPTDGINYYRLSQTDFDGTSETFSVLSVDVAQKGNDQMELFPNPTSGFTNIAFAETFLGKQTTINVSDLNGKLLQSQELFLEDATLILDLENLPQGMYIVTAQAGRQLLHKKLSIY